MWFLLEKLGVTVSDGGQAPSLLAAAFGGRQDFWLLNETVVYEWIEKGPAALKARPGPTRSTNGSVIGRTIIPGPPFVLG